MEHDEPLAAEHATESWSTTRACRAGMPQLDFSIYPNLIFWLVVALVALYFILTRIALPRIGTVLAERNDAIANDIELAALLKRRAEEAEAAYNAALAQARDEAHRIAAETKAQIDKELAVAAGQGRRRDRGQGGGIGEAHRRDPRQRGAAASRRSPATPRRSSSTRCLPQAADAAALDAARRQPAEGLRPWSS